MIQQESNKFCSTLESIQACSVSDIGMKDMVHYEGKSFNLTHYSMIMNEEDKFKAQYTAIKARGGKEVVEEQGGGEKLRPQAKTNSKKDDKREAASLALQATL
ncbi:Lectin-domain containing receptor kinase A4.3 [Hordeum vulgare]|nr:Lectin-domain containing receptor kinase A4.3 [Hordeum vulgare]